MSTALASCVSLAAENRFIRKPIAREQRQGPPDGRAVPASGCSVRWPAWKEALELAKRGSFRGVNHDFHTFTAFRLTNFLTPPALRQGEGGIDKAPGFILLLLCPKGVDQIHPHITQYLILAPLLKAAVDRFVVIALRQPVPLGPVLRIQRTASRILRAGTGLRPRRPAGIFSSGKMLPDPLPLVVGQMYYTQSLYFFLWPKMNFEIGSRQLSKKFLFVFFYKLL